MSHKCLIYQIWYSTKNIILGGFYKIFHMSGFRGLIYSYLNWLHLLPTAHCCSHCESAHVIQKNSLLCNLSSECNNLLSLWNDFPFQLMSSRPLIFNLLSWRNTSLHLMHKIAYMFVPLWIPFLTWKCIALQKGNGLWVSFRLTIKATKLFPLSTRHTHTVLREFGGADERCDG